MSDLVKDGAGPRTIAPDGRLRIRQVAWLIAIVGIVALATAVWRGRFGAQSIRPARRAVEGRVTAGEYRALRGADAPLADSAAYAALEAQRALVDRQRTPDTLHGLAVAFLGAGQPRAARELLAEAVAARPADADLLSDLAVAEMAMGNIADAAEHSAHALELDPARQPAAFNWALSLEKLSNRPAAIDAWEGYLRLDPGSGWAGEARRHLAALRAPRSNWQQDRLLLVAGADRATIQRLVGKYPQHVRTRIQNILLPAWAVSGNPAELALMEGMASVRAADDPYLADMVAHAAGHRSEMAPGVRAFKEACAAEDEGNLRTTAARFNEAAGVFERSGSPLYYAAAIYSASALFFSGQADALRRIEAVEERLRAAGDRYPSMTAEAAWVRAIILARSGRPHDALDAYDAALKSARKSGEIENEVALGELVATQFDMVGDPAESEAYRMAALRRSDEILADPERMYVAFAETAFYDLRAGRPRLALAFIASQMALAREMRDRQRMAWSEGQYGLGLLQVGRIAEAEAAVGRARQEALFIEDAERREGTLADIDYTAGRIAAVQARHQEAVAAFTSSLKIWDRHGWRLHAAEGYASRAESHLATGDRRGAEEDFRAGIGEMEKQRTDLEPAVRIAYFERSDRLFSGLIDLLVGEDRPEDALSVAERKRARVLLDQLATDGAPRSPLDARAIAAALSGETCVLEIVILDRSTELWLITRGQTVHARVDVSRAAIEGAVNRHLAAIAADDIGGVRREGRWLYERLVAPVAASLPDGADLVIVPDSALQAFPFAALVAPDGRYLLERNVLAMAPSATVFVTAPAEARDGSVLVTAQPAPEGLERLPHVETEATQVAGENPRAELRIGAAITPSEFLDLAGEASLIHFAGHARTNVAHPSRSALMFESAGGPPAELTARIIGNSHLRTHPLVILAACSTGRGKVRRNEGTESLAAAFLQAGAGGVVATLWDVDDAASGRLFRAFHGRLRQGARPSSALRDVQRSLIHSTDADQRQPSVWASAFVYGTL